MNKSYLFKQIAVVLCCAATVSFSSQPSGGSAGSLSAAAATAAVVATAAHNADSKTLKDVVENPASISTKIPPFAVAFSPNGDTAVIGTGGNPLGIDPGGCVTLFRVDCATGKFTQTSEMPSEKIKKPEKIFYFSQQGLFAAHSACVKRNFTRPLVLSDTSGTVCKDLLQTGFTSHVAGCMHKDLVAVAEGNSLAVYRFDYVTQSLISIENSPFELEFEPESLVFSPSGNFIAIAIYHGVAVYALDCAKGTLKRLNGLPAPGQEVLLQKIAFSSHDVLCIATPHRDIKTFTVNSVKGVVEQASCDRPVGGAITGVSFSPDGRFVAVSDYWELNIYTIDAVAKIVSPIKESSVTARTKPSSVIYSPQGDVATVVNAEDNFVVNAEDNFVSIYEVDRATGKFTPLTGGLLQSELARRAMVVARDVLVDHGPLVHEIIARYLGAIYDTGPAPAAAAIEEITEADGAITKTHEESDPKKIQETRVQLFEAIAKARFAAIAPLLTPFTINARDEENRTALMHAVRHSDTDSIVEQLLKYKGEKQYSVHNKEAVTVDLNAVDYDGNTALIYAVKNNRFKAACMVVQEMSKAIIAKANKKGETALSLAQEEKVQAKYASDDDYKALMKLLEQ